MIGGNTERQGGLGSVLKASLVDADAKRLPCNFQLKPFSPSEVSVAGYVEV